jgi:hypothetical protein
LVWALGIYISPHFHRSMNFLLLGFIFPKYCRS